MSEKQAKSFSWGKLNSLASKVPLEMMQRSETFTKLIELLSSALRRPIHAADDGAGPTSGARMLGRVPRLWRDYLATDNRRQSAIAAKTTRIMSDASSQDEDDLSDKGGSDTPLAEHTGVCSSRNGSYGMTRDYHDVLDLCSPGDSCARDQDRDRGLGVDADMLYIRAAVDGVGAFYV
ncbi:hypothetical protein QBC44DRAFT_359242 [Cladorrhinum sp. PSN332]|nr:hypothetical protein QBC44DRAFT_359242 [Cladorrhinum sp. PSN332]